jgi:hypothetical protein
MYVRVRQRNARLLVSLAASRRVDGKHEKEHIGFLGSVSIPASVEERIRFWHQLHQRLSRLANRVGGEQGKLLAAIHRRIPIATVDETHGAKVRGAEGDVRSWEGMRDANLEQAEGYEKIAATVQKKIENFQSEAAKADAAAAVAKERVERIKRGED